MTAIYTPKPLAPPGSIEFELTDLDNARKALDELPAGVDKVATLEPHYWDQRRRKAVPSDRALQGTTIDWLLTLPDALRPRVLCDSYPRAANSIGAAWHGGQYAAVLDDLLCDRRGKRRGFPPEVKAELEALRLAALRGKEVPGHPGA